MRMISVAATCALTLVSACASGPTKSPAETGFDFESLPDQSESEDFEWCSKLGANQGKDYGDSALGALHNLTEGEGKLYPVELPGLEGRVQVGRSKSRGPVVVFQDDEGHWNALPFVGYGNADVVCAQEGTVEVMTEHGAIIALWTVPAFGSPEEGCVQGEKRQYTLVANPARGVSMLSVQCDPGAGVEFSFQGDVVLVGCSDALDQAYSLDRLAKCPTL